MEVYMYNDQIYTKEALYDLLFREITTDDIMELVFPALRPDTYFLFDYFSDDYKLKFQEEAIDIIMSGDEDVTCYEVIEE